MRRYMAGAAEIAPGRPFEHNGLAHPSNWRDVFSDDDLAGLGVTVEDLPDSQPEPTRALVSKVAILRRLDDAGLLETARAAMDAAPLITREIWNARNSFFSDDPQTIGFLKAIGADVSVILAPE